MIDDELQARLVEESKFNTTSRAIIMSFVMATVVVLGTLLGLKIWNFHDSQVYVIQKCEVNGMRRMVELEWFDTYGPLDASFTEYVASSENGVEFPGWKPKEKTVPLLKKAIDSYNLQTESKKKVTYTRVLEVLGPDLRHTWETTDHMKGTDVNDFFKWCNDVAELVYKSTGEPLKEEDRVTNIQYLGSSWNTERYQYRF